jgi:CubicO group peptidase (beta-lactamase class C family)
MKNSLTLFVFLFTIHFSFSQNFESKIDSIVSLNYTQNEPGISILIAKDGKPIYKKAFGKSNMELGTSMKSDNVFQIGSITKQFTAVSILMLEEQGKLKVDDEIVKYIPDYPTEGNIITIHHLLNHTSGIKNSTPVGKQGAISKIDMSSTELVDYFKNKPLDFIPGSSFKYSNAGYILLGRIIEIVSGQSYEDFIEKNIFKKIGMLSSNYGSTKEIIRNRASGYQNEQNIFINSDYISLTLPYAAGSILSTVDDLLKWQNALNSNTLIKKSSLEKAISPTRLINGKKIPYGYGWRMANLKGSPVLAHTGSTKGFTSVVMFFPKENIYVTALTNCNCKKAAEMAKKVSTLVLGKPISGTPPLESESLSARRKTIIVSSEILKQYTGTYQIKANVNISIRHQDNTIFLLAPGQTKAIELFAESDTNFYVKVSPVEITFNRNQKGEITSLTLNQSGRQILANKI